MCVEADSEKWTPCCAVEWISFCDQSLQRRSCSINVPKVPEWLEILICWINLNTQREGIVYFASRQLFSRSRATMESLYQEFTEEGAAMEGHAGGFLAQMWRATDTSTTLPTVWFLEKQQMLTKYIPIFAKLCRMLWNLIAYVLKWNRNSKHFYYIVK